MFLDNYLPYRVLFESTSGQFHMAALIHEVPETGSTISGAGLWYEESNWNLFAAKLTAQDDGLLLGVSADLGLSDKLRLHVTAAGRGSSDLHIGSRLAWDF